MNNFKKVAQMVQAYQHYPANYALPSAWQQLKRPLLLAGGAYALSEYLAGRQPNDPAISNFPLMQTLKDIGSGVVSGALTPNKPGMFDSLGPAVREAWQGLAATPGNIANTLSGVASDLWQRRPHPIDTISNYLDQLDAERRATTSSLPWRGDHPAGS